MEITPMINRVKDHKGNLRIQLSKYWPDGSRFKRYMPNPTVAKKTQSRIDEAIAMGTWRELKEELYGGSKEDLTVEQFSKIYLDEYCKVHNRRPDFKEETLQTIVAIVGSVRVKDFSRSHAHYFIKQRSKTVKGATVNRGLAVIKNMLTFAIEKEIIDVHPLARFHMLPEEEVALRIPTLEEERRLVAAVMKENSTIGAYVGILGETGARMQEGLPLQWPLVNLNQRLLTIEETKKREGAAHTSFRLCDRVAADADSDRGMSVCFRLPRYDGSLP
jgi:integrase